jgi:hypothetical protein
MRYLLAGACALALLGLTLRVAPIEPVIEVGLAALLLVVVGLATPWRWPVVGAASLFAINHALVLWGMDAPFDILGACAFGLALLLLLQFAHLSRCMRRASAGAGVIRAQIIRWAGFAVLTFAATVLGMVLAGPLSRVLPAGLAPVLAALAALGVMTALTIAATRPRGGRAAPPA